MSIGAISVLEGLIYAHEAYGEEMVGRELASACRTVLGSVDSQRLARVRSPLYRLAARMVDRRLQPGVTLNYALRKRYIRDRLLDFLNEGTGLVVSLGAGLDPSPYLMARGNPGVLFYELDTPGMIEIKRAALTLLGPIPPNLRHIPCGPADLQWPEPVRKARTSGQAVIIAEGVLMYLGEAGVRAVLDSIATRLAPARILMSALMPWGGNPYELCMRAYARLRGEPIKWTIEPGAMTAFMESLGYSAVEITGADEYGQRYLAGRPELTVPGREFMALAATPGQSGSVE